MHSFFICVRVVFPSFENLYFDERQKKISDHTRGRDRERERIDRQ